jgi:hypothetical protein
MESATEDGLNGARLAEWGRSVRERDGRCLRCGIRVALTAHHIIRKEVYPLLAYELWNGVTLCWFCHAEEHKDEEVYRIIRWSAERERVRLAWATLVTGYLPEGISGPPGPARANCFELDYQRRCTVVRSQICRITRKARHIEAKHVAPKIDWTKGEASEDPKRCVRELQAMERMRKQQEEEFRIRSEKYFAELDEKWKHPKVNGIAAIPLKKRR